MRLATISLFALLVGGGSTLVPVSAQDIDFNALPTTWQQHLDQQTTGAAASAVLHSRCATDAQMHSAHSRIGQRLRLVLATLASDFAVAEDTVSAYAEDAYRTKVAALWQSTEGVPCARHTRLVDLSRAFGYPADRFK